MEGILFDSVRVLIDPRSIKVGGSWQGKPINGVPTAWSIHTIKFFFKQTLEFKSPTVLDIGANTGTYCLLSKINPEIQCYAFEPTPQIYEILNSNINLNNLQEKVKTFQRAISNEKGTANLKFPMSGTDSGLACLGKPHRFNEWVEIQVPVTTLDELVDEKRIQKVDLIKIDTEGCELFVLKGAEQLIKEYRPCILLEYHRTNTKQFGYEPEDIKSLLNSWGYNFKMVSSEDMYCYSTKTQFPVISNTSRQILQSENESQLKEHNRFEQYKNWINTIAFNQRRLFYRDQTPESLSHLTDLVLQYKPDKIIEFGTLYGLSLRAWVSLSHKAKIKAVDLSFKPLLESCEILPVDLSDVQLIEQNILQISASQLWGPNEKVLLFIDAHDLPNISIMQHVLTNLIPYLPDSSIVCVDDVWYSPEHLSNNNAPDFLNKLVGFSTDPLQPFEGYYAPYWAGGSFMGFQEVHPLMMWVNANKIRLNFRPEGKSVYFKLSRTHTQQKDDFNPPARNPQNQIKYAKVSYNPLPDLIQAKNNLSEVEHNALSFYQSARKKFQNNWPMEKVIGALNQAYKQCPTLPGLQYAKAVCFANLGKFEEAQEYLAKELALNPKFDCAQSLLENIKIWAEKMMPCKKTTSVCKSTELTLFTMPKPFKGKIGVIQRNAITSWTILKPCPEIILFGDEPGTAELAEDLGLKHIPNVETNEYGTPLVNSIFNLAAENSDTDWIAYVNADVILLSDFAESLKPLKEGLIRFNIERFLLSSQRCELNVKEAIAFNSQDWQDKLREQIGTLGVLDYKSAVEMFFFSRGLLVDIPPFALGRTVWDNWLVWKAKDRDAAIIDATEAFTLIHQSHDYSHVKGGYKEAWTGIEAQRNHLLAGDRKSSLECSYVLTKCGLRPGSLPETAQNAPLVYRRINLGIEEMNNDNFRGALDHLDNALSRSVGVQIPQSFHYTRALCLINLKKFVEAEKGLIAELQAWPGNFEAKKLLDQVRDKLSQKRSGTSMIESVSFPYKKANRSSANTSSHFSKNVLLFSLSKRDAYRSVMISPHEIFCGPDCESESHNGRFRTMKTPPGTFDIRAVLEQLPSSQHPDLLVVKTDATGRNFPVNLAILDCPKLLILGDTHHLKMPIRSLLLYANQEKFDFITSDHDRQHLHYFREAGVKNVLWSPCFNIYPHPQPYTEEKLYDISFVGQAGKWHPYRKHILAYLKANGLPINQFLVPHVKAAEIYAQSLINLNISLNGDLNLRIFEVLSSGGFLLTDKLSQESGLNLLFKDGEHLVCFENERDLLEKIQYYVKHPQEAKAIARKGYEEYIRTHTPDKKIQELIDWIFHDKINLSYKADKDKRSVVLKSKSVQELLKRVALYEFFQELHLKKPNPLILIYPSVDSRLVCDIVDLPRLKFCIKNDGLDIPNESLQLFQNSGLTQRINTVTMEDLRKTSGTWDAVVLSASEIKTIGLKNLLGALNFKWLVVSDGLDCLGDNEQKQMKESLKVFGFEKRSDEIDAFFWKNRYLWGEILFTENKIIESITCFKSILEENPINQEALNNLGVISYQLNDLDAAEDFLRMALSLDRRNRNALINLANIYLKLTRFKNAADLFEQLTMLESKNPSWWYYLGFCYEQSNQNSEAIEAYQRSLKLGNDEGQVGEKIKKLEKNQSAYPFNSVSKPILPPKNILVINNLYPPQELGGYGRLLCDFANILKSRGHFIYALTSDTPYLGKIEQTEPEVDRSLILFGSWQNGTCKRIDNQEKIGRIIAQNCDSLRRVINDFSPDLCLLGNIDFLSHEIIQPLLANRIPVIHHLGNSSPGYTIKDTPKSSLYHLATASHWLKNDIIKQGYPLNDISVVFPGALVEEFKLPILPAMDKLRIAYAGIVLPYKGPHILIQALKRLHDSGIDYSCAIAGTSTDENFVHRLKQFVNASGIEKKVEFLGFLARDELKNFFAKHNVLVFPSIVKEAFGISQVEAMAAGLTVVTSGTGGAKEIVEHEKTGIIFKSEDDESLARELANLTNDKEKWRKIAIDGQYHAGKYFNIEQSVNKLEQVFSSLENHESKVKFQETKSSEVAYNKLDKIVFDAEKNNYTLLLAELDRISNEGFYEPETFSTLGNIILKNNVYENPNAMSNFWRLFYENQKDADIATAYSHYLWVAGQSDKAIETAKEAIKLDPNSLRAYRQLGMTQLTSGHHIDAYKTYSAALNLNQDYTDAKIGLRVADRVLRKDQIVSFNLHDKNFKFFISGKSLGTDFMHVQGNVTERQELDFIKIFQKNADIIIDVGANVGNHTVYFMNVLHPKKIIVIEPNSSCLEVLRKNIALNNNNNDMNVELIEKAVGKEPGSMYVPYHDELNAGLSLTPKDKRDTQVEIIPLDSLNCEKVDFIKIDVEGMELDVLAGATSLIKKDRPNMIIEVQKANMNDFLEFLAQINYRIVETFDRRSYLNVAVEYEQINPQNNTAGRQLEVMIGA